MVDPIDLCSPRLCLRRLHPGDAAAICSYRALPEVARFQSWEPSYSLADAAELIAIQERTPVGTPGSWLQLGLTLAESGELIGDCGIHFLTDDRQLELGITLSPRHQCRGLAAEAIECVLRYAFDSLGKHRVWAMTDTENHPAARLFRRLGFRQEGHFVEHAWYKGSWCSELMFAMLRREWEERNRAVGWASAHADPLRT